MKEILLNWIKEHYGENEASNPCYDIDLLSEYLETKVCIDKEHYDETNYKIDKVTE